MTYRILTDMDISARLTFAIQKAIEAVERALIAKASDELVAPPRFSVRADRGALVFTAGAEMRYSHTIGFRVYDTFPENSPEHTQLVAVFDSQTGRFKGLILANMLGAIRTAAINAVALKYMARPDVTSLGILGSGFQAKFHLQAAMAVKPFKQVTVYSPTSAHLEVFVKEMQRVSEIPIQAAPSPEEVVRKAEVLICATRSQTPVFNTEWLQPGTHINTIGPKFTEAHEVPIETARRAEVIATDSLAQVNAYAKPFFLENVSKREQMVKLSDVVVGRQAGRLSEDGITLFCSVGLAGTEVVVADVLLKELETGKNHP